MNYKNYINIIVVFSFILVLPENVRAGEQLSVPEIAAELQQTYEQTRTIQADFQQKASVTGMPDRQRIGRGKVKIKKPGLIRWDYMTPEKQILVSDGEQFSFYLAEENQMIVTTVEQYLGKDVIYSFFKGSGQIMEDFKAAPAPEKMCTPDNYCLKLTPKESHPQVETFYIWCDRESYMIKRLRILDPLGGFTDIKFSNIVANQPVSDEIFSFSPPSGTEIIRQ
ncbi:MAG: outer membrane lipoprotein chaperone LolA [Thermodesulfobacteriota bacterium]